MNSTPRCSDDETALLWQAPPGEDGATRVSQGLSTNVTRSGFVIDARGGPGTPSRRRSDGF